MPGLARRDHRRTQVQPGHRSARSLGQAVRDAGDAGRAVEALLDPAGDDAHHAGMPGRTADHQRRMPLPRLRLGGTQRIVQHRRLDLLALPVHRIERGGKRRGLDRVLAQQQPQPEIGLGDPPRRVDARAEREAAGPGGRPVARLRHVEQRRDAGTRAPRHHLQALADQRAIDAGERHHVAHGGQRDQVEQADQVRLLARIEEALPAQRAHRRHRRQERDRGGAQR